MMPWFWLILAACSQPEPPPVEQPQASKDRVDPNPHVGVDFAALEGCESCHEQTVVEWKQSMHSHAHKDNDPVYGAMLALRMKKQGDHIAGKCVKCHNPMAPDAPDSEAGKLGVGCGACHSADALVSDELADGRSVCLGCHDATKNPKGVATCTTGPENASLAPCVSCHMPVVDGRHSHTFPGPHRAWYQDDPSMLRQAVAVSMVPKGPSKVEVTVHNTTGHAFPSGFPGRVASIRLTSGGKDVSPDELLFRKVYVDENDKPTLPPFAAKLALDTRLEAGESRAVTVDVADSGAVNASLVFALLPKKAAGVLGLGDAPEAKPVVVPLTP